LKVGSTGYNFVKPRDIIDSAAERRGDILQDFMKGFQLKVRTRFWTRVRFWS